MLQFHPVVIPWQLDPFLIGMVRHSFLIANLLFASTRRGIRIKFINAVHGFAVRIVCSFFFILDMKFCVIKSTDCLASVIHISTLQAVDDI